MASTIFSGTVQGLDGHVVTVEAAHTFGLRNFLVVGLPDAAVKEARERVHAALKFAGYDLPRGRIAVNLAPADVKKQGTVYDLPIALTILSVIGVVDDASTAGTMFLGELALDGAVRPINCVLLMALAARDAKLQRIFVPKENVPEALLVRGVTVFPVETLGQVIRHLRGEELIVPAVAEPTTYTHRSDSPYDMAYVRGQGRVKRALEIAAAGRHNILLYGPPGTGKTLLARTLPTILPSLSEDEALEVTKVYSVAGALPHGTSLVLERPFRSPHHTTSGIALVGGGSSPRPGEVSLAHHGVLFLDEFPEFQTSALENLRQPLEDGSVTVSRAVGSVRYPAKFMLVAAMNPCPCGFSGDPKMRCICTMSARERYRKKISGPLLDRIDLMIEVPKLSFDELTDAVTNESSAVMRERVQSVKEIADARGIVNAKNVQEVCALASEEKVFLRAAVEKMGLSARSYTRILKVARTIADLAGATQITIQHLAEAMQYRPRFEFLTKS